MSGLHRSQKFLAPSCIFCIKAVLFLRRELPFQFCDIIPDSSDLRKEGFILAYGLRGYRPLWKSCQWEQEAVSHIVPTSRNRLKLALSLLPLSSFPPFHSPWDPAHGVLLTVTVDLSSS